MRFYKDYFKKNGALPMQSPTQTAYYGILFLVFLKEITANNQLTHI